MGRRGRCIKTPREDPRRAAGSTGKYSPDFSLADCSSKLSVSRSFLSLKIDSKMEPGLGLVDSVHFIA